LDQAIIGSIFTVIVFVAFFGAVWWAFTSKNKEKFEDAANIIFEDDKQKDTKLRKKDQES
jgi:cytochrome c oxidase cbb3-type subunit 4